MRILDRWNDRKQPRLWSVLVAIAADEAAPAPGDTAVIDELGSCLVVKIRPVNSPEPRLQPGERVYGADVQAPEIGDPAGMLTRLRKPRESHSGGRTGGNQSGGSASAARSEHVGEVA